MRPLPTALAISLTFTACRGPDAGLPPAYRDVPVPEGRLQSSEALTRGQGLYEEHCNLCHGERGNGQGQRSAGFAKRPTRFADPVWRRRTTPRRVFFVVREGVPGTPMPSWSWLDEGETWDLVAFVLSLAPADPPTPRASPDGDTRDPA